MEQTLQHKWNKCLEIFKDNLPAEQYNAWFASIVAIDYTDDRLTLGVESQFVIEQIESRYLSLVSSTLRRVFGDTVHLYYKYNVVSTGDDSAVVIKSDDVKRGSVNNVIERQRSEHLENPFQKQDFGSLDSQLNDRYSFDNYYVGTSNRLAVSIGNAIADDPNCKTFNPLFVFGTTGVGKTHLIQAIGNKIKSQYPMTRVLYLTARIFESQFTTAVMKNKLNDFISFYQSIDVLILDDIQDFAGKQRTQNTFFHIFNHLHQNQKQLIMTSDCRPVDMDGMVPRLISRFKWGMTVELERPDLELRKAVLKNRALSDGLQLSEEVIDYIAQQVTDSVRDLEGIVVSLLAHATMLGSDITLELAKSVIANTVKVGRNKLSFDDIIESVAEFYHIEPEQLYGKSRKREISDARQLVMYFAKKQTTMSSTTIGRQLSRNHATVLHACKQIEQRIALEPNFREEVREIEAQLL